jgi:Flp pilus assembly protein TadG
MLLILAFGVVGVGRVTQAQLAVSAVAREAARAGALAEDAWQAQEQGRSRGEDVAQGYGLSDGSLTLMVDPGSLERGGQVRATARYEVGLDDLPLLSWARTAVGSEHVERIDLYQSRWNAGSKS